MLRPPGHANLSGICSLDALFKRASFPQSPGKPERAIRQMQLIIAEKPSVATDLARALPGTFQQQDGYWESPDILISWAVGHLLELSEPEDYDPELKNWSLANLPVLPDPFLRRPRKGQSSQLRLLKKLAKRGDIESLVNACDAAREGELIFREIAEYLGLDVPIQRLWLQSMTPASIREAFAALRAGEEFEGLSAAAYCRAEADWLIGINATRGITKRLKGRRERGVWSAGRVQTPTLALLVHREIRVLAHVPVPFWRIKGEFEAQGLVYEGQYRSARSGKDVEKLWSEADAKAIAEACRQQPTSVVEKVTASKRAVPPLHSLTSLQKECNSRYGLSARRTLQAAQRLYESHKVLTYPRTDSNCLPEDYRSHVEEVLQTLASGSMEAAFSEEGRHAAIPEAAQLLLSKGLNNTKRNFNDAGVSDHFAIIPTGKIPDSPLGGDDARVFELVMRRFVASFLTPSRWQKVVRETKVQVAARDANAAQEYCFYTEASRMVEPGWQLVDRRPKASEQLGELGVPPGEVASGRVQEIQLDEDATRPPKRYTEAGLLKAMEAASDQDLDAWDEIDDDEAVQMMKEKGLGTPATRADIIEALIAKGYVLRSGKTLRPSAKGITLVDFLERLHADDLAKASQTAEMESHLYQVENGQRKREDYMQEIRHSVTELVEKLRSFSYDDLYAEEEPVGVCPKDGFPMCEGLKGYRCTRKAKGTQYKVTIKSLGKEAKVGLKDVVAALQEHVQSLPAVVSVEPDVKRTNAYLHFSIAEDRLVEEVEQEFLPLLQAVVPADSLKEELSMEAVEPDACGYTIWKEFRGRYLNRPVVKKLLLEKDSGPIEGFVSMRGETYAGRILVDDEWKLVFEPVKDFKGSDDSGAVAPELISYPVDPTPFVPCPLGKGMIIETPTHFESSEPGGIKMPRTVCKREMRRVDLLPYFDPEVGHTEWIEDFVSRKGRNFTARLVRKPNGRHGFEFKPREGGPRKKKATKKKVAKKKVAKKKVSKKVAASKKGED